MKCYEYEFRSMFVRELYGSTTGNSSASALHLTNVEELKIQPSDSVPSTLIFIHSPSSLRPTGAIVSPFDKMAIGENVVLGPLRTFSVIALTLQSSDALKF